MFRAVLCSSSGGQIVLLQHLVSSLSVNGRTVRRLRADSKLVIGNKSILWCTDRKTSIIWDVFIILKTEAGSFSERLGYLFCTVKNTYRYLSKTLKSLLCFFIHCLKLEICQRLFKAFPLPEDGKFKKARPTFLPQLTDVTFLFIQNHYHIHRLLKKNSAISIKPFSCRRFMVSTNI
jgi:hypothetical protein